MNNKLLKITYYVSTVLISLLMLASAVGYFFNHSEAVEEFVKLGFPAYLVYFVGVAKALAVAVIWLVKGANALKEWAYAGLFFDFLLAFSAHINAGDGEFLGAIIATILLMTSYCTGKEVLKSKSVE